MANILYIGDSNINSTSAHRAYALERIGHTLFLNDPYKAIFKQLNSKWLTALHHRTGYRFVQTQINKWIHRVIRETLNIDLIWVDSGELIGRKCLNLLKIYGCPIILYNIDDPTGKRDGRKFDTLLKTIQLYDLVAVVREETQEELNTLGVNRIIQIHRSYDELAHQPFKNIFDIPSEFKSDVAFIGTWMRNEQRDEFLLKLIKLGVPISIWGDHWQKSPYFSQMTKYYKGSALHGRNYVAAIQGAKICLGLLSKGNRDLHTTRTLEVPYAGGLFCAERTKEHQELYQEGVEAVFWSDADECARVCHELLTNNLLRDRIRLAGMQKVRELKVGNEDVCKTIVNLILNL